MASIKGVKLEFTVGICAYNEESNIGKVLDRVIEISDSNLKEIIVVASGCTDRTEEIVKGKKDERIKLISEKERNGKPSAINKIFKEFETEYLVMLDADVLPENNCFESLLKRFNGKVGAVSGKTLTVKSGDKFWDYVGDLRFRLFDRLARENVKKGKFVHISGYIYAIKKGIVDKIPDIINDDLFIGIRVKEEGYLNDYSEDGVVMIQHPLNVDDYVKQRKRVMLGHYQIEKLKKYKVPSNSVKELIPATLKELSLNPVKLLYFLGFLGIDKYADVLAKKDLKKEEFSTKWEYVESSKKL